MYTSFIEFIFDSKAAMFGSGQMVQSLQNLVSVSVAGIQIALADLIKCLGVTFNTRLSFDQHVEEFCKGCYYHLRDLRLVRAAMSVNTASVVAGVVVIGLLQFVVLQHVISEPRETSAGTELSRSRVVAGTLIGVITSSRFLSSFTGYPSEQERHSKSPQWC